MAIQTQHLTLFGQKSEFWNRTPLQLHPLSLKPLVKKVLSVTPVLLLLKNKQTNKNKELLHG